MSACGSVFGSSSTSTPSAIPATATPDAPDLSVFRGFIYPIAGACLPTGDQLMPNAPRDNYREVVHGGIDFYEVEALHRDQEGHLDHGREVRNRSV